METTKEEFNGPSFWNKLQASMNAAQGQAMVTLKAMLYGYGVTAIVFLFSTSLLYMIFMLANFFGMTFGNSDMMPAIDMYNGG